MESRREADEEWLYEHAPGAGFHPSVAEVEAFVERVHIKVVCGMIAEGVARREALDWMAWARRNKQEAMSYGSGNAGKA